ncbi:MAG: helix-turn-helix domain-containing protein [Chryseolinea sp.]
MIVSLLVFDGVVASSVAGVVDLITGTNRYLESQKKSPVFEIELVGEKLFANAPLYFLSQVKHASIKTAKVPNLIIVPSFNVGNGEIIGNNKVLVAWIKKMRGKGAEVASLCLGCYFLAECGLLDGIEVTSHWAEANQIQKRYPALKMKSDLVITDNDGIYTSGGAFSSLKLIVYLIEKFCGRTTALVISKMFEVEMDRKSQAHFAIFTGLHHHNDVAIISAQRFIEENYRKAVSFEEVSTMVNMGNRNFIRRFKAATSNTPSEYLQRVRIESAKRGLENGHDIASIIDDTGYTDVKTFRSLFKRYTGLSPMEYKRKYSR